MAWWAWTIVVLAYTYIVIALWSALVVSGRVSEYEREQKFRKEFREEYARLVELGGDGWGKEGTD